MLGSLASNYGVEAVARLLANLSATDSMAVLQHVIPDPLAQADLDWRDFIAWRLELESALIAARAEEAWLRLYETSDDSVRRAAYARFNRNAPAPAYKVADQYLWTNEAGNPQLRASVASAGRKPRAGEIHLVQFGKWRMEAGKLNRRYRLAERTRQVINCGLLEITCAAKPPPRGKTP